MPLSKEVVRKDARNPRKLELVQEELRKFGSRCFSSSEAPRWISRLWFQAVCRTLPALPAAKVWVIKSTRIFCSLQERKSPRHVRASVHARTALFVRVKPPCSQRTACPSNLCPFIAKFFGEFCMHWCLLFNVLLYIARQAQAEDISFEGVFRLSECNLHNRLCVCHSQRKHMHAIRMCPAVDTTYYLYKFKVKHPFNLKEFNFPQMKNNNIL